MNDQFNRDFQKFIGDFLDKKGQALAKQQKENITSARLRRTGRLANSSKYEVTTDSKTGNQRLAVGQKFYGRIMNAKKSTFDGKAAPPERLKAWIEEVGIQNFAGHKGKSPQRALNDIAWGLSKTWNKKGRKGRPHGYNQLKKYLKDEIMEELLEEYQVFTQDNIV